MTERLLIRRLTGDDVPAIHEIETASMPAPWSPAMFAGEISKPASICLGAVDTTTGELLGYLIVSRYVDAWHVMNLVVVPHRRRAGIGSRLLDELFDRTATDGQRGYTLEVRASNAGAIRLYERVGFRAQGVRRAYYTDNREDAVIMWRDVSAPAGLGGDIA